MSDKKLPLAARVLALAEPIAAELGLSVWDVFYGKEGQAQVLRITIDKPQGVGIDDCEALSRAVDPLLDSAMESAPTYRFEVSSPGLGRRISTDRQMDAYIGKPVRLTLIRADETGERQFAGTFAGYDAETVSLCLDGQTRSFTRPAVAALKADDDNEI